MATKYFDVLGIMSGTSLDGLDIACCRFHISNDDDITFEIVHAETVSYSQDFTKRLASAHKLNACELLVLHNEFGQYIGEQVNLFCDNLEFKPILISSHGHTVMHMPFEGITVQIGNGAVIAAVSGVDTICDFRSLDVALGGQGAPLVPFGDLYLFSEYDAALNLGGFSNITLMNSKPARAFDICPVNIVLNDFARREGFEFDRNGLMASTGKIYAKLLTDLEAILHYQLTLPPSLSREWVEKHMIPLFARYSISVKDFLRTYAEHIALRIASVLETSGCRNCLVTGGGAYNSFLMNRVGEHTSTQLIIPPDKIVQYKEALVFAFLGLKRFRGELNVLSAITGAKKDSSSGVLWKG